MNPHGAERQEPDTIIVHSMMEYFRMADGRILHARQFLIDYGLSAHVLVSANGWFSRERMDTQGAYHAKGHNTNSLGIEFLVPGIHDTKEDTLDDFYRRIGRPYVTNDAYRVGKDIILEWIKAWPIKQIVRHSDIDPTRKRDPGEGFPWSKLLDDVGSLEA